MKTNKLDQLCKSIHRNQKRKKSNFGRLERLKVYVNQLFIFDFYRIEEWNALSKEIRKKKGYVATLLKEKRIGIPEVMSKPKDFTNQR